MAEVEGTINSRPLVPVSVSDTSQEPLTPNHLLLLRSNPNLPPGLHVFSINDCYVEPPHWPVKYSKSHVFGAFEADFC